MPIEPEVISKKILSTKTIKEDEIAIIGARDYSKEVIDICQNMNAHIGTKSNYKNNEIHIYRRVQNE